MLRKNPFATPSPTLPPVGNDPHKNLKRWQLECGRARKRTETFAAELDSAREAFKKISRDSVADERLDISAVTDDMTAAQTKVEHMEKALVIATERLHAAEAALAQADMQVKEELETAALACLRDVAAQGDLILGELEIWASKKLSPAFVVAVAATNTCGRSGAQTAFLHAFRDAVGLCVHRACQPFIPDGRVGLPAFKDRKLSSWMLADHCPRGTTPREQQIE